MKVRSWASDALVGAGLVATAAAVGLLAGWAWALLVVGLALLAAGLAAAWAEGDGPGGRR